MSAETCYWARAITVMPSEMAQAVDTLAPRDSSFTTLFCITASHLSRQQILRFLMSDAIQSGEPYYLDPTNWSTEWKFPDGVTPIPYMPDAGPGSLGAGGQQIPGVLPSRREYLGANRIGTPGQAVSVIESAPYMLDPSNWRNGSGKI